MGRAIGVTPSAVSLPGAAPSSWTAEGRPGRTARPHGTEGLVRLLEARREEEADLTRRCDGDGCGVGSAQGRTADFCQADLSGCHPTTAPHVALPDPARILREVEAERRVLARHARDPWPCHDSRVLASPYRDHPGFPARACSGAVASRAPDESEPVLAP
ncbi:DUF6221 family protein [Streptomyces californicus]|uniref:DUF6221 family protein n=1 Tax=Streptomyces californicus TaxID=67351 RepID=UPI003799562A